MISRNRLTGHTRFRTLAISGTSAIVATPVVALLPNLARAAQTGPGPLTLQR